MNLWNLEFTYFKICEEFKILKLRKLLIKWISNVLCYFIKILNSTLEDNILSKIMIMQTEKKKKDEFVDFAYFKICDKNLKFWNRQNLW